MYSKAGCNNRILIPERSTGLKWTCDTPYRYEYSGLPQYVTTHDDITDSKVSTERGQYFLKKKTCLKDLLGNFYAF